MSQTIAKPPGLNGATPPAAGARPRYAQIVGWGMALPDRVVSNHDLARLVETSDEWIRSRTGIQERRLAVSPKESTLTLAVQAAREALKVADVPPSALDLVICATTSPEYLFPATACARRSRQDGCSRARTWSSPASAPG